MNPYREDHPLFRMTNMLQTHSEGEELIATLCNAEEERQRDKAFSGTRAKLPVLFSSQRFCLHTIKCLARIAPRREENVAYATRQ